LAEERMHLTRPKFEIDIVQRALALENLRKVLQDQRRRLDDLHRPCRRRNRHVR
jgi:hypothetical protein